MARTVKARFWNGLTPGSSPVTLAREGEVLALTHEDGTVDRFFLRDCRIEAPLANLPREIGLPRGARLRCDDLAGFRDLFPQTAWHGIRFLESRTATALLALAVLLVALFAAWRWGIPAAAQVAADNTPAEVGDLLGKRTRETLDQFVTKPSALSEWEKARVERLFSRLTPHLKVKGRVPLHFRSSPSIGPNAFALPDGSILVTDAMVKTADDVALLGVLAHEAGHLEGNHALQGLYQRVGLGLLWAGLVGDATQLADISQGLVLSLSENNYSRGMEHEADVRALVLLRKLGHDGKPLARLLMKLSPPQKKVTWGSRVKHLFDNHPDTGERARFLSGEG